MNQQEYIDYWKQIMKEINDAFEKQIMSTFLGKDWELIMEFNRLSQQDEQSTKS